MYFSCYQALSGILRLIPQQLLVLRHPIIVALSLIQLCTRPIPWKPLQLGQVPQSLHQPKLVFSDLFAATGDYFALSANSFLAPVVPRIRQHIRNPLFLYRLLLGVLGLLLEPRTRLLLCSSYRQQISIIQLRQRKVRKNSS